MLRICQSYQNAFTLTKPTGNHPTQAALNWYVKPARLGEIEMLLFINERSLMPILIPGPTYLRVAPPVVFAHVLQMVLGGFQFATTKIRHYTNEVVATIQEAPEITDDFRLERITREYQAMIADFDGGLLDEDEQENLIENLSQCSVELAQQVTTPTQGNPLMDLSDAVMTEFLLPASLKEDSTALRQAYARYDQYRLLTAGEPAFAKIVAQLRSDNELMLKAFQAYLETQVGLDSDPAYALVGVINNYVNDYLLAIHPLTPVSDLTMPADFLLNGPYANDEQEVKLALEAVKQFGRFASVVLWHNEKADMRLFSEALIKAERQLAVESGDSDFALTSSQRQIQDLLAFMLKNHTDVLAEALTNLTAAQRAQLAQLLQAVDQAPETPL